jgi:hypothetical protein
MAAEAKKMLEGGRGSQKEACLWQMKPKEGLCVADENKRRLVCGR